MIGNVSRETFGKGNMKNLELCYERPSRYGKVQFRYGGGLVEVALLERDGVTYYKHITDTMVLGTSWRVLDGAGVVAD